MLHDVGVSIFGRLPRRRRRYIHDLSIRNRGFLGRYADSWFGRFDRGILGVFRLEIDDARIGRAQQLLHQPLSDLSGIQRRGVRNFDIRRFAIGNCPVHKLRHRKRRSSRRACARVQP